MTGFPLNAFENFSDLEHGPIVLKCERASSAMCLQEVVGGSDTHALRENFGTHAGLGGEVGPGFQLGDLFHQVGGASIKRAWHSS